MLAMMYFLSTGIYLEAGKFYQINRNLIKIIWRYLQKSLLLLQLVIEAIQMVER